MARPATLLALVLSLLALALPALALADSDPPSDVLLSQNVYYPYSPPVSKPVADALTKVTADAKRAGYPIRVAIVAGQNDLGSVPSFFGRPDRYAKFLQSEITFGKTKRPLFVAMPAGYGLIDAGAAGDRVPVKSLPAPSPSSDVLARAAITAVARLSSAAGHPVATPKAASGGATSKSSTPWWVFVLPVVLVILGVAALSRRAGRRDDHAGSGDAEPGPTGA